MFHTHAKFSTGDIIHILLFLFAVLQICFLVSLYPVCSDDYAYMYICGTDNRVETLSDVITSQLYHYMHMNGRFVVHVMLQAFLLLGKPVFNLTLPCCYALCVFLIVRLSRTRFCASCAFVALSFWAFLPCPGQTILWECGAFNYIVATCLSLVFLSLFLANDKKLRLLAIPTALLVGNSHEGISIGLFVAILLFTLMEKQRRSSLLSLFAVLFLLLGVLSNLLSPGGQARLANQVGETVGAHVVATHLQHFGTAGCKFLKALFHGQLENWLVTFLLILCASLNYHSFRRDKKLSALAFCLCLGAFANLGLTFLAKIGYPRAFYGASSLALLSSYLLLLPLLERKRTLSSVLHAAVLLISIGTCYEGFTQIKMVQEKEACVIAQHKEKQTIVFLPEHLGRLKGRFIEKYGDVNTYKELNRRSFYYGGPLYYSVISNPREQEIIRSFDFNHQPDQRVFRIAPDGILVHLKKKHIRDHASGLKERKLSTLDRLKGAKLPDSPPKKREGIPCASFVRDGEYYILMVSTSTDITLEIVYEDGEKEELQIPSE